MKAKVFHLHIEEDLEKDLNEWLSQEELGQIRIEHTTDCHDKWRHQLVVFYSDRKDEPDLRRRSREVICSQCKRRPAIEGMKICPECREYQAKYRKKRKADKKKNRYP